MTAEDEIIALGQSAAYAELKAARSTDPQTKREWEYSAQTCRKLQLSIMRESQNIHVNARRVLEDLGDVLGEVVNGPAN
jgi:hypothetical protein